VDNKKIDEIKSAVEGEIKTLVLKKLTAKVLITVEVHFSQGGIGAAFIENYLRTARDKIF